MNRITPEKRSISNYENCYARKTKDGTEYYNKEYYNSDFSRKIDKDNKSDFSRKTKNSNNSDLNDTDLEEIQKLIILEQIKELL
jgi:hypothetical protein